jgi:hypothetical protein
MWSSFLICDLGHGQLFISTHIPIFMRVDLAFEVILVKTSVITSSF